MTLVHVFSPYLSTHSVFELSLGLLSTFSLQSPGLLHPFYLTFVVAFLVGLYILIDSDNLIRKLIGLNVLQVSVFLLLITIGYGDGAVPPLLDQEGPHANPLPHAMVLTAIVVGVSLTALGLALVIRLHAEFDSINVTELERGVATDKAVSLGMSVPIEQRGHDRDNSAGDSDARGGDERADERESGGEKRE